MTDHTTPSNNDVPTPEDRHTPAQDSQATESTVSGAEAKAESTGMANGETRDTQLRFLEMSALFSLDKNVHASLPDDIRQGLKSFFERTDFELFVELPNQVVKLHIFGQFGEWTGTSVRYTVHVKDKGDIFAVPMLFSAQPDPDTPLDPRFKHRLTEKLEAASAEDGGTDPDSASRSAASSASDSQPPTLSPDQS